MNIRLAITLLLFFTKICPADLQPKRNLSENIFVKKIDKGRIKGHFVAVSLAKRLEEGGSRTLSSNVFYAYHKENVPYTLLSLVFLLNDKTRTRSLEFLYKDTHVDCLQMRSANEHEVDFIKERVLWGNDYFDCATDADCKAKIDKLLKTSPTQMRSALYYFASPSSPNISDKIPGSILRVLPAKLKGATDATPDMTNVSYAYHRKTEHTSLASLVFLLNDYSAHVMSTIQVMGPEYTCLYVQLATAKEIAFIKESIDKGARFFDPQTSLDCMDEIKALLESASKDEESEKQVHAQALKHATLSASMSSSSASPSDSSLSSAADETLSSSAESDKQ